MKRIMLTPVAEKKSKTQWEKTEDEVLISAYMKHNTDAIVGTNQKKTQLWNKVQRSFVEAQAQRSDEIHPRTNNMLRSWWRRKAEHVGKWIPSYEAVRSGENQGDAIANAIKIYEHQHGTWVFDHAWRLLRRYNKWESKIQAPTGEGSKSKESQPDSSGSGKRMKMSEGGHSTPETLATDDDFAPTYHDYVLYNHGESDEGATKYRTRTFVPTGPEMDAVRRNKHMFGNRLEDIQLSSLSSSASSSPQNSGPTQDTAKSEAMNSSLLMNASNPVSLPYDLSLIEIDMSNVSAEVPPANHSGTR